MGAIDSSRDRALKEMSALRVEIAQMKSTINVLEGDKDQLMVKRWWWASQIAF